MNQTCDSGSFYVFGSFYDAKPRSMYRVCNWFINRRVVGSDRCEKKGNCHFVHTKKIGNKKVYGGKMSHSGFNII